MAAAHAIEGSDDSMQNLVSALDDLERAARMARKHRLTLVAENHYSKKARSALANLRRNLTLLRAEFPATRPGTVNEQLGILATMVDGLSLEKGLQPLFAALRAIRFHVESDLAAAVHVAGNGQASVATAFLPPEIVPASVYRRILEEVNSSHAARCYNGCAALLRRLTESLIIEAFEGHGIEARIKGQDGEYVELKALIGRASGEPTLRLSRHVKSALPNLKFLGDLSLHGRKKLVFEADLERLHNDARAAIQELALHLRL